MSQQLYTTSSLFSSVHPNIEKRTSVFEILISCLMLLIGISSFLLTMLFDDKSSSLSMLLMVSASGFTLYGIFRLFWRSKQVVYAPTGSKTYNNSLFFDLKYMPMLNDSINSGNFPSGTGLVSEANGNLRLDYILSKDHKFAAVQLFQFVPYSYQPVTTVHYFTDNDASSVVAFLSKTK